MQACLTAESPLEEWVVVGCAFSMACKWRPRWQDHTLMLPSLPPVTVMDPPVQRVPPECSFRQCTQVAKRKYRKTENPTPVSITLGCTLGPVLSYRDVAHGSHFGDLAHGSLAVTTRACAVAYTTCI